MADEQATADKLSFSHKDTKAQRIQSKKVKVKSKNRVLFFMAFQKKTPSLNRANLRV
jgi:hypothetical protein